MTLYAIYATSLERTSLYPLCEIEAESPELAVAAAAEAPRTWQPTRLVVIPAEAITRIGWGVEP